MPDLLAADGFPLGQRPSRYRCRHGISSAKQRRPGHPKYLYRREDDVPEALAKQLGLRDSGEVASYIQANGLTITCDKHSVTVTPSEDDTYALMG